MRVIMWIYIHGYAKGSMAENWYYVNRDNQSGMHMTGAMTLDAVRAVLCK